MTGRQDDEEGAREESTDKEEDLVEFSEVVLGSRIEEKTNHLLKDTIKFTKPSDIAYLINTLYFKGQWMDEFPEHRTEKQDFHLENI